MSRISYVNGAYLPHAEACVSIDDRGYVFADGVYEYFAFFNRRILDEERHLNRLERSLKAIEIAEPVSMRALSLIMRELLHRNPFTHGGLYLQISRGVARRDHPFPKQAKPSLILTVGPSKKPKPEQIEKGVGVCTAPDIRWARRDIKSISLLPNILARQLSASQGLRETWLIQNGVITEGSASNSYIVDKSGKVITHPANQWILGGITRDVVLELARANGIAVEERPFTLEEVRQASEAFLTSTSANVLPVTRVDDITIGNGKPGPVTQKLLTLVESHIEALQQAA
jgi:D-alanine transaminase